MDKPRPRAGMVYRYSSRTSAGELDSLAGRRSARYEALRLGVTFVRPRHKPLNVSFFGHFGSLNTGNESTLLAILARLRSVFPEGKFRCICVYPETVAASQGIDAVSITTRVARIWDREVRLGRRVPMAFVGVGQELRQYVRAFKKLKGTDLLLVPGTGLVTDAYGLSHWGPYSMFKWVLMAKLRRCKVLFVSVGAGPIDQTRGRVLTKAALSLADYRSYRDDASRDCLTRIGFRTRDDPVYPDLVFSLPEAFLSLNRAGRQHGRRVVGVGLMAYAWNYGTSGPRLEKYTAYLESLAVFAKWLIEHDYDIRLLIGDGDGDPAAIEDFRSVLQARLGAYDPERVVAAPIESVQDLLAELAATDVVVATRFHNVLLAFLLNKPVIAITFHHKCSSLMRQMKLSGYCHDMHDMDSRRLIEQFCTLERNQEAVKRKISQGVDEARAALDEQYDFLFASP